MKRKIFKILQKHPKSEDGNLFLINIKKMFDKENLEDIRKELLCIVL